MLKTYHEKTKQELVTLSNKLGLENPMHKEDYADLEAKKEEDTESEVRLGNDQQPIKLQNSQILKDLSTKLSHLPSAQRKELAEVINQYREVFPDVPNTSNLVEQDVDVGDSDPIKQHPCRVSPLVNKLVCDIYGCEWYIDDVVIYSNNWADHVRQIKCFFQVMREAKLTIILMKSKFTKVTVKYLGHIVGQGQVRPLGAKTQTIVPYPHLMERTC